MTIWAPILEEKHPLYRALADALAADINEGRLKVGDQLPTHRDLADALGVTVGTISRGYAEAERRGLTHAVVGRGTFVRGLGASSDPWPEVTREPDIVDLTLSLPVCLPEEGHMLAETLRQIAGHPGIGALLEYAPESAAPHQKAAAAAWLACLGLNPEPDEILVTAGSQHALNVVLPSLFTPGQVVLTGALSYPSLKSQARIYGVRLRGVDMDDEGMCPDALERACRQEPRPSGLYIDPTLQNPTSAIMSRERRLAIARIAEDHDLLILEDDVHALLLAEPPSPLAALVPGRTVYLASVAKCLVPGLRTGFLLAPASLRARLLTGIHTSIWMPPPLMVEVTTKWLGDGTADRLMAAKRQETIARQQIARAILGKHGPRSHPNGYQLWLELPEPWATDAFVSEARERGVKVIGASAFAINRHNVPHAVRLSIGVPSRAELTRGLGILDEILTGLTTATY